LPIIPLTIRNPARVFATQPLTVGMPAPKGLIRDVKALHLVDPDGRPTTVQTRTLATWPDGSVKWFLLDLIAREDAPRENACILQVEGRSNEQDCRLQITEGAEEIQIHTGPTTFRLSRHQLPPFLSVCLNGNELLDTAATRCFVVDVHGTACLPHVDEMAIEERGPVRVTLRYQGSFRTKARCCFVARFCFFVGTGLVRCRLTLHNPRRARHPGGLWDLGDPNSLLFRSLSLELGFRTRARPHCLWTADPGQAPTKESEGDLEIYQDSSGGDNWQSKNHVNRHGRVPCSFRGYRARSGGQEAYGLRAKPVVTLRGPEGSLSVAVPEFWQQFPKALATQGHMVRVGLFPEQAQDGFELQGGEQKTHTVWLEFATDAALNWAHEPAWVDVSPEWIARCDVLPAFVPRVRDPQAQLEVLLSAIIQGERSFAARRELIDEFGWRHYGDVYADHENAYFKGQKPVISHYNNQYDVIYGLLFHYCRTGDRRWFELLDPLARHVIDIDIYHTTEDKAAYNGGLFWHTDHYVDAATATHRTFSWANAAGHGNAYGGGPGNEHNYTTGLLHYYFLTGDEQARQAVLGLADWVVDMDDGKKAIFGVLDEGPTGAASATTFAHYHGPGRGAGNSINALLDGWLLSGQRHYLEKAESLIHRCTHPADDLAARDLLHIENRWSYTVFLSALLRYLHLKAEYGELDAAYAYAQASLIHYARWMVDQERPFFDRRDEMEFPTETWAAQELRKANVLRLAAAHVKEPLSSQMLCRGAVLAERAWKDLLSFESCDVARCLVLLMQEGARDAYLRGRNPAPAPRPAQAYEFGTQEPFVPLKARVFAQLKSPRGLAGALVRLADVRRWPRWLSLLRK
jgi:hypothetical protein